MNTEKWLCFRSVWCNQTVKCTIGPIEVLWKIIKSAGEAEVMINRILAEGVVQEGSCLALCQLF